MADPIKVWSKFTVSKDTNTLKFKIIDVTRDRHEEFVDLVINYFIKEETTFRFVGVPEDEEALKECRESLLYLLESGDYHGTACCVDNDDGRIGNIVGASIIVLTTNHTTSNHPFQTKSMLKLMEISDAIDSYYDVKKIHNLDKYYEDRGVAVHPDFRGCGIAQQLFKARRLLCKEHGVPITGAWMTSYGSQKAAQRDGWEVVYKLDNEVMIERFGVTFHSNAPPFYLFMVARI